MRSSLAFLLLLAPVASGQGQISVPPPSAASPPGIPAALNLSVGFKLVETPALIVFTVEENLSATGQDLNGDGDTDDRVLALMDRASGQVTVTSLDLLDFQLGSDFVGLHRRESSSGLDQTGDGSLDDDYLTIYDIPSGTFVSETIEMTGLGSVEGSQLAYRQSLGSLRLYSHDLGSSRLIHAGAVERGVSDLGAAYVVSEANFGSDLNGDMDLDDTILRHAFANSTNDVNLGTPCSNVAGYVRNVMVFTVGESQLGSDVNGDGDLADTLIRSVNLLNPIVQTIGLVDGEAFALVQINSGQAYWLQDESFGGDLNGDQDEDDRILVEYDVIANTQRSLFVSGTAMAVSDSHVLIAVDESEEGVDLSNDGDTNDFVLHVHGRQANSTINTTRPVNRAIGSGVNSDYAVYALSEPGLGLDLNGDGDTSDRFPEILDLRTGETQRLDAPAFNIYTDPVLGSGFLFDVYEEPNGDGNGDGDFEDRLVHVYMFALGRPINTGISAMGGYRIRSKQFLFYGDEESDGVDHTGDGDLNDRALFLGRFK